MGSCMDTKDLTTPLKLGDKEKLDGSLKLDKKKSVFDEDDSDGDMFKSWAQGEIQTDIHNIKTKFLI